MAHAYNFRDQVTESAKMPKMGPKVLRHMQITPGKSGGASVEHVFDGDVPNEEHIFGATEGPKLMAHLAKHLRVKAPAAPPMPAGQPGANSLEQ
jgi:hypothetical protein